MFGKGLKLFKIFDFEVRIDSSWLILAVLIILSLTGGYFPYRYEGLGKVTYVIMGIIGAIGLFISIIIHELSHSLVARKYGIPMKGITLFMFGGVAQMEQDSNSPKAEFMMAIAGPIASIILAFVFYAFGLFLTAAGAPAPAAGVARYLGWINLILAIFNLLPAFPLDGGRILRSALWAWKKNLRWATRIASDIGSGFGIVLIVLGILSLLAGSVIGGLWWALIGMFLRGISQGSYRQVLITETLEGEPVRRIMRENPVSVEPSLSITELVEKYIYHYHFKMFPVVEDGKLIGCVSTRNVKEHPREEWDEIKVADICGDCAESNTIAPDTDAAEALKTMSRTGNSRLMVVENGELHGIVSLKDLMRFMAVKLDLEGGRDDGKEIRQMMGE